MGFFDELSNTLNRGAEVTARTGRSIKIKAQIAEKKSQRNNACMRLGTAVYDKAKDDPALYDGFEDLIKDIADLDVTIESFQAELEKIEAESAASTRAYWVGTCPQCGYHMTQSDAFCSRCGTKMPKPGDPVCDSDAISNTEAEGIIDVEPIKEPVQTDVVDTSEDETFQSCIDDNTCPECGKVLEHDDKFCSECGAKSK